MAKPVMFFRYGVPTLIYTAWVSTLAGTDHFGVLR